MRHLLQRFLQLESSSGILLFLMAVLAVLWANSPLAYLHQKWIDHFLFWINEGLMSLFFLVVGLELKRGFLEGELSRFSQILLPAVAALGGMVIPALIYVAFNYHDPVTFRAWATPVATDIAFAMGALSFFHRHVPTALKLFLLALAIFDDIGAIVIIIFVYSHGLSLSWLLYATLLFFLLCTFNVFSVLAWLPYLIAGVALWFCLLQAGIHPTIAGVLLALTIPAKPKNQSLLHSLENALHPWVAYLVMPLFALANAGFSVKEFSWQTLSDTVVLGIIFGLFIGKQLGVFGFSWLLIRSGFAKLPEKTSWVSLYGVSILCGIGFTMSLFLGTLSFTSDNAYLTEVRLGVMLGSILSGVLGMVILYAAFANHKKE